MTVITMTVRTTMDTGRRLRRITMVLTIISRITMVLTIISRITINLITT
jgi:hypothetical protein